MGEEPMDDQIKQHELHSEPENEEIQGRRRITEVSICLRK